MPTIEVNGASLFYDLTGPADAPVVAFSNSLGTTVEMWDQQTRALAGRYRVLRYDTHGHGRSKTVWPVSIDRLADDWAGLLQALHIPRAHIVGLSLGGMTAQALAIRHPEQVASLTLMATAPFLPPADGWEARARAVREHGLASIVDAVLARWFTLAFAERGRATIAYFRAKFLSNDAEGYALACLAIRDMDLRPKLGAIKAPTLVVAGAEDPVTTVAMGQDLAGAIGGARFEIISGAAHIPAIEQPDLVNAALLRFLGEVEAHPAPAPRGVTFEMGLANRKAVLGVDHVQRSLGGAGPFVTPWQDFITRNAWGEIWGDPTIPWKTRSMVTLAMMVALHREEEFKLHVRPALKNGVTLEELRALLMQTAIYAGVPATNAAFRWVREVLGQEIDGVTPVQG
jgi:3-oxoadipate enol-lactonase/4-carboxymuconolactone decarboxylase